MNDNNKNFTNLKCCKNTAGVLQVPPLEFYGYCLEQKQQKKQKKRMEGRKDLT